MLPALTDSQDTALLEKLIHLHKCMSNMSSILNIFCNANNMLLSRNSQARANIGDTVLYIMSDNIYYIYTYMGVTNVLVDLKYLNKKILKEQHLILCCGGGFFGLSRFTLSQLHILPMGLLLKQLLPLWLDFSPLATCPGHDSFCNPSEVDGD